MITSQLKIIHYFVILVLFVCATINGYAQNIIEGKVKSNKNEPLIGATIIHEKQVVALTDEEGYFKYSTNDTLSAVRISYLGFSSLDTVLKIGSFYEIELKADAYLLDEIKVSAALKEEQITNNIIGFELVDSFIFSLHFTSSFKPYHMVVRDLSLNILAQIELDRKTEFSLFKSCSQDIFLYSKDKVYLYSFKHQQLFPYDYKRFMKRIKPCILLSEEYQISAFYYHNNLRSSLYLKDRKTNNLKFIYNIGDKSAIASYKNALSEIKRGNQISTMRLEGKNAVKLNDRYRNMQKEAHYLEHIHFKPKNKSFCFEQDSCVIIFNHTNYQKLKICDTAIGLLSPPSYIDHPNWVGQLFFDEESKRIYNMFKDKSKMYSLWEYVFEKDLFEKRYIVGKDIDTDAMHIHGGYLYYISYLPFNGAKELKRILLK